MVSLEEVGLLLFSLRFRCITDGTEPSCSSIIVIAMEWHGTISCGFMESLSMSRLYNKSSVLDDIMVRLTVYVVIYKLLRSALYRIEYRCFAKMC